MRAVVSYTVETGDDLYNDQDGIITIRPESGGEVLAAWSTEGGKGHIELISNTTKWDDDFVYLILDDPNLNQGIGRYVVDIQHNDSSPSIKLVQWLGD